MDRRNLLVGAGLFLIVGWARAEEGAEVPAKVAREAKTLPAYELTKRKGNRYKDYLGNKNDPACKFYAVRSKVTDPTVEPPGKLSDLFDYEISKQSAFVYIPKSYAPKTPHGILLHIGEEESGSLPAGWDEVLTEHKLIYASPNKAGRVEVDAMRIALALDTIETLREEYAVDKDRIILSGCQTGGAVALIAATLHSRKFCGILNHGYGLLMRKTEYGATPVEVADDRNKKNREKKPSLGSGGFQRRVGAPEVERPTWEREFSHADQKDLKRFAKDTDIVFFIGGSDNHERVMRSAEQWSRIGNPFLLIDDPAAGGSPMSARWLAASCRFIEGELPEVPEVRFRQYEDVRINVERNNRKKKAPKPAKD